MKLPIYRKRAGAYWIRAQRDSTGKLLRYSTNDCEISETLDTEMNKLPHEVCHWGFTDATKLLEFMKTFAVNYQLEELPYFDTIDPKTNSFTKRHT
jgi:hypothetical protein